MNKEILISLVQQHEELYNIKHVNYYNQQKRDSIWEEIGELMNENGRTCREHWTKIRDNHRKALILRKTKGRAGSKMKPPKYNKELRFLLPYLQDDDTRSMLVINTDPLTKTEVSNPPSPVSSMASIRSNSESMDSAPLRPQRLTAVEINPHSSLMKHYLNEGNHSTPVITQYIDEQDPLIGFFINMGRTVKGFPIQEQIKIKKELFSIVNNAEMNLLVEPNAEITGST